MIDLTPLEVRKKKGDFRRQMRGYDPALVDDFLDVVADRLEMLVRENMAAHERLALLESQVKEFREREKALTEALVSAQEMREQGRQQIEKEAEFSRRQAEHEAEQIRASALQSREREEQTLRRLRARQTQLIQSFRTFLERELAELAITAEALEVTNSLAAAEDEEDFARPALGTARDADADRGSRTLAVDSPIASPPPPQAAAATPAPAAAMPPHAAAPAAAPPPHAAAPATAAPPQAAASTPAPVAAPLASVAATPAPTAAIASPPVATPSAAAAGPSLAAAAMSSAPSSPAPSPASAVSPVASGASMDAGYASPPSSFAPAIAAASEPALPAAELPVVTSLPAESSSPVSTASMEASDVHEAPVAAAPPSPIVDVNASPTLFASDFPDIGEITLEPVDDDDIIDGGWVSLIENNRDSDG